MIQQIQLSNRLRTVAKYIQQDAFLADIGSDHAYLPVYCMQQGRIKRAIAGEVVQGPFESAKSTVQQYGLSEKIDVRMADGLEVITGDAVDHITICGMGGKLIRDILERGRKRIPEAKYLILQPNVAANYIRAWAIKNQWCLVQEEILEEDHKIYEVLVYERQRTKERLFFDVDDILFGPFLRKERNMVFLEKWTRELTQLKKIRDHLEQAPKTKVNLTRLQEIHQKIIQIEGEIK